MVVIGMDVGATKIKAGIVAQSGEVFQLLHERTDKRSTMNQIIDLIRKLKAQHVNIQAIGIGTAGRVDFNSGSILYATSNLPNWTGTRVKDILESEFMVPTIVDNDGNVAAFAEGRLGVAVGLQNYVCITLGTGVGGGVVAGGKLVRGTAGGAGEVGHMILYPDGNPCNCGKTGCWEQYVSGTALHHRIADDPILSSLVQDPEQLFWISQHMGSQHVTQAIDEFVSHLSTGLSNIQRVLEPECIVIGGGIVDSSYAWWDKLSEALKEKEPLLRIEKARMKNNAGLIGAGLLAYQEINET